METSASLLERLRQPGQQEAWSRFVDLYTPLLYYWALRTGCQESDAADLVQEVLARLVRKIPEFHYDKQKSFRAWLRTVAHNCWRNLRRGAKLPVEAGAADLRGVAGPENDNPFWETEYQRHLVGRALDLIQEDFQPGTWKAFLACVVDGRPTAAVATELGVSVGTVHAAKSRVLSRLRQELAGLLE